MDIFGHNFVMRLAEPYSGHVKYVSVEEDGHGHEVLSGLYVLTTALPEPPPSRLIVTIASEDAP